MIGGYIPIESVVEVQGSIFYVFWDEGIAGTEVPYETDLNGAVAIVDSAVGAWPISMEGKVEVQDVVVEQNTASSTIEVAGTIQQDVVGDTIIGEVEVQSAVGGAAYTLPTLEGEIEIQDSVGDPFSVAHKWTKQTPSSSEWTKQ